MTPAVKAQLEKTESYQHFTRERARLDRLASTSWEKAGRLNTPKVLAQEEIVAELGEAVLEEIKIIQFMQAELSYEDFQKQKRESFPPHVQKV